MNKKRPRRVQVPSPAQNKNSPLVGLRRQMPTKGEFWHVGGVQVEDQANLDAFKLRWRGSTPIGSLTARGRTTVSLKCRLCVTA